MIKLENIWKYYIIGNSKVYVLKGINLEVDKGEFLCILGPSGSGKSTLLHIIGCLDKPSKGKVIIDNEDVSKLDDNELALIRREKIGFVFQFFYLFPYLNALESVMLPMLISGKSREYAKEKAMELLELVGLEKERFYNRPNQLSGGQQQKVAIARAIANNPKILLADEPTGNLDYKSAMEVMKIFEKINNSGTTIIMVTHNQELTRYADRIIRIKDGKIIEEKLS
ncbi:MAG: ABC transporter ATP-binding protein [Candidatus Aenigmarchaeota archaeon]|nr:ABC transporter ATP-binding protein [Candidatus Aenigmarchaeota archaeon]